MNQTVSVALCTFNGERFLSGQLKSLIEQARAPDEIVICDDCSNDRTISIISEFSQTSDVTVKLIENSERLGIEKNFELAIKSCSSDIIFLCDQDDIWDRSKIAAYLKRFQENSDAMLVASDSRIVDQDLKSTPLTVWKNERFNSKRYGKPSTFLAALNHSPFSGHAIAIRRSCVDAILPIPRQWMFDQWVVKVCAAIGEIELIHQPLTLYRRHSGQNVGSSSKNLKAYVQEDPKLKPDYFQADIDRFEILLKRIRQIDAISAKTLESTSDGLLGKIELLKRRRLMREGLWLKWKWVSLSVLDRSYFIYARGWLTMARDIIG